jgi:RNA polymerase sigma-70 factor (ECF subfamily)
MDAVTAMSKEAATAARSAADPLLFAELYDRYYDRVHKYVRYRVGDAMMSDDVVAQVFLKALSHIQSYDADRAPFSVWLMAIARNAVNDHLRALQRRRWLPLDMSGVWPSGDPGPEQVVLDDERNVELLAAVGKLSDRERDILGLKFALGFTNRRIAELTGLSASNVGVIVFRAVRRLRKLLSVVVEAGDET